MFFTFTLDTDEKVISLLECLEDVYGGIPDCLEDLHDRLVRAREMIFEARTKELES